MVTTCSRSATRTNDCVLLSWVERNLGRYEHARARRARARARHRTTDFKHRSQPKTTQSFTAIIKYTSIVRLLYIDVLLKN